MNKHKRWFWGFIVLTAIIILLILLRLFGMAALNVEGPPPGSPSDDISGGRIPIPPFVDMAIKFLSTGMIMAVVFLFLTAMFLFPPLSVIIAVFSAFRNKKVNWKILRLPLFLLLGSLAAWNVNTVITNGWGYLLNHDFGSNVYNEGYIIPRYEELYDDELTMSEKNVIDADQTVFTLRSGKTGEIFTVQSENYSTGAGAFDRLHLSDDYGKILGLRLKSGEKIELPFDEYFYCLFDSGQGVPFSVRRRGGKTEVTFRSEAKELQEQKRPAGNHFFVSMEDGILKLEIPLWENELSVHCFEINKEETSDAAKE